MKKGPKASGQPAWDVKACTWILVMLWLHLLMSQGQKPPEPDHPPAWAQRGINPPPEASGI